MLSHDNLTDLNSRKIIRGNLGPASSIPATERLVLKEEKQDKYICRTKPGYAVSDERVVV
ncbi:MAG: hypothetical protein ACE5G0_10895 [Rhodothermales bacterium]